MKLGATSFMFIPYGSDKYRKMREFGLSYIDYGMQSSFVGKSETEFRDIVEADKKQIDEAGLKISQIHGPWVWPLPNDTKEHLAEWMESCKLTIRMTEMIGVRHWVIHPIMPFGPQDVGTEAECQKTNLDFFSELLPYAKTHNVVICFENMPMPDLSLASPRASLDFIRQFNDDNIKLCLDTGHSVICGTPLDEAVRMAGKDLAVLHVHDNHGTADEHLVPGSGTIDFTEFKKALLEIGFSGSYSLESSLNGFFPELPIDERLKKALEFTCVP